jgi:hypothetical protein
MRWTSLVGVAVAVACALGAAPRARADVPAAAPASVPRVVIVVELAVNLPAGRADALAAALADALNRELEVDALGGADVTRRLPPEGLPDECVGDAGCIATIATRLEADQLLFLAIVQVGDHTQVDATWVDAATGASASRPRAEITTEARAVSVFGAMAQRYLPDARARDQAIVVAGGDGGGRDVVIVPGGTRRRLTRTAKLTGGVAIAATVGAAALGLSTRSMYKACEREGTCTDDELDAVDRRALFADLTLGVAVAASATTLVLYLLSGEDEAPTVTPAVGATAGGATLGLGGRF